MDKNLEQFVLSLDTSPLKKQKEMKLKTFFIAMLTATAFFIPYILYGQGYFIFYGDFNVQQIPFYQLCHRMIREGNIFWNFNTDLGVNFIGSYSFYTLGSPFFWLTLPFPEWMLPYMMGPLLILKFSCAALTGYLYIRRFTKTPFAASLGGLLYAFSGFSVYNIFFNHFHEAIIVFPLLLLAIELFIAENKRGAVLIAVFFAAFVNYFFFFGMVVFVIIYWFVRVLTGRWKLSFGRFVWLAFECIMGVLLAAVMLLPSFWAIIGNSRLDSTLFGWDTLLYGRSQIWLNILEVFFFPPDIPARPVFFPGADVKWSSLGGWLPVFGMVGVMTFMSNNRKHWINKLLGISIFMALVPILNSAFTMFNSAYYARWFYMPILIMCLATAMATEQREANWIPSFRWVAAITVVTTIVIGLMPSAKDEEGNIVKYGLYTEPGNKTYFFRYWITCAIAIAGLVALRVLLIFIKKERKKFFRAAIAMVCVVSVIYAGFFIGCGVSHTYDIDEVVIPQLIEGEVELDGDEHTFRIDVYDGVDNTGMYLGYDSINTFHSIVPTSVTEFYEYIGEDRGVASRPTTESYAARSLLSVKYLLNSTVCSDGFMDENGETKMPGYIYLSNQCNYDIYENEYYIPYGFTYDYYMTKEVSDRYSASVRSNLMLKAILLDEEDAEKYSDILTDVREDYSIDSYEDGTDYLGTGVSDYIEDCKDRRATAAYSFSVDSNGFEAKINLEKDNLVFFSVPYDEGWTATVNGEPVEIVKANVGFMAVKAPAGDAVIRFNYRPKGLIMGLYISIGALIIAAAYIIICAVLRKKHPDKWTVVYPEGEELKARFDRYDSEDNLSQSEERADEIEEYYDSIKTVEAKPEEAFPGGFTVDVTVLDKPKDYYDTSSGSPEKIENKPLFEPFEAPNEDKEIGE